MRVLNRYILGDFLKSFLVTFGVLTFVMYIGTVVRAIDFMSRGVSGALIMRIFAYNIPYTLGFVIPMSVMTTTLLHFGRLSADGEITAMKASGLSLWQIASPVLFASVLLSLVCLYVNADLSPRAHYARRNMVRTTLGDEDPTALIEEGQTINSFPGIQVYVGRKEGPRLEDIVIHQFGPKGIKGQVRARSGEIRYDSASRTLDILLEHARMTQYDEDSPSDETKARHLSAEVYPLHLDLTTMLKKTAPSKKPADLTFLELVDAQRHLSSYFPKASPEDIPRLRANLATDAAQRLALALSCFAFTLLSVSLGLTNHRRQSSIGIGLALLLIFFFYLFIIISDAMVDYLPQWRPDLVPWIPVVFCEVLGLALLAKNR